MHATITIKMDNAAFCESGGEQTPEAAGAQLALILRDLAKHVENGSTSRRLMDSNGNHVGTFEVVP